jgi:hypothetical protein
VARFAKARCETLRLLAGTTDARRKDFHVANLNEEGVHESARPRTLTDALGSGSDQRKMNVFSLLAWKDA